jgi:protein-S-isoprenylcysteine O-methyltransferase Ste14
VALQMSLLAVIALVGVLGRGGWEGHAQVAVAVVGALLLLGGLVLAAMALTGLGSALTAMPAPLKGQTLRADGVYAVVRHPIYGGLILMALGFSLQTTPWALAPTAALAVVLDLKRRVEEDFLTATYRGYPAYRQTVRKALIPYVW